MKIGYARSLPGLVNLVNYFDAKGAEFQNLQDRIDTSTPVGQFTFHIFAAVAQFERDIIQMRTIAGLKAARARGRFGGRPKSMFGGSHLGCKCPLLEPHFGYFLARSAAMGKKMSLLRTQNQPFSPPKHHLQTCSQQTTESCQLKAERPFWKAKAGIAEAHLCFAKSFDFQFIAPALFFPLKKYPYFRLKKILQVK